MGRHAPESLHGDHSSQMPWNVSVSRHNSVRQFGIGLPAGVSSNISGRGPGIEFGRASALIARRGSRLTSASPLLGKGGTVPRYSSLELPEQPKAASGEVGWGDIFDNGRAQVGHHDLVDDLEFQLYGPAAAVDTQTAAQSQWIAATLDTEANNFLAFLRAEIDAKIVATKRASGQLEEQHMETVTFEELLPPEHHSKVVAAQGLLHVLSLATKGLIEVRQEQAFERIEISTMTAEENEDGGQDMEV
jgi:meiotic recombination protein REC8